MNEDTAGPVKDGANHQEEKLALRLETEAEIADGWGLFKTVVKKRVKEFAAVFAVQFVQYCLVSVAYRAMAQARYAPTFLIDLVYGFGAFYVIQKVAKAESKAAVAGYVLGGAFGSCAAIWITQKAWGM